MEQKNDRHSGNCNRSLHAKNYKQIIAQEDTDENISCF